MIDKIKDKPIVIFFIYVIISLGLYYRTIGAGMVFDFNGWTYLYLTGTYADVLNSFGYPGLHQMEQLAFFSIFKLIHFNTFGWYFIFATLHGFTAFVSFKFLSNWLETCKLKSFTKIAFLSSFMFLLSPFAADTVVSKVTIHYLMSNIFIYSALFYLISFYKTKSIKYFIYTVTLFVLALFSLEISYVFPALSFIIWISLLYFNNELKINKKILLPIITPFVVLILFLLLHKIVLGGFIGHYGSDVHTKFIFADVFSNVIRYFASYISLFDFWNYKYKEFATQLLLNYSIIFFIPIIFTFSILAFYGIKNKKTNLLIMLLAFCLAVLSLAPISNLYYAYMFPIENDRYSYLSSIFMYLFIVLIIYQFPFKKLRTLFIISFFTINIYFLNQNINKLQMSSQITWGLLNDFRWFDKEVIILADPDNFNGAKMFSSIINNPSAFSESLLLHTKIDRREHIKIVYQMNVGTLADSVNVTKISETEYKVELAQWGNWYWKNMIGATSFENDWCKAVINKKGLNYYDLTLKNVPENTVLIYAAGDKWTEVE